MNSMTRRCMDTYGSLQENLLFIQLLLMVLYRRYNDKMAYGQSKLANILHAKELSKRLKVPFFSGFLAFSLHLFRRMEHGNVVHFFCHVHEFFPLLHYYEVWTIIKPLSNTRDYLGYNTLLILSCLAKTVVSYYHHYAAFSNFLRSTSRS